MNLSIEPQIYFMVPSNSSIVFNEDGATINKKYENINFYLPLTERINASVQTYLNLDLKTNMDNFSLTIVFYYDHNCDGGFTYADDYVKSVVLNQSVEHWLEEKSYTIKQYIPITDDVVIQIGLFLSGDSDGYIQFSDLKVYKIAG